jgi:hypothetical protein
MLSCYIICNESLVEVDRLIFEVEGIDINSKVEVVRSGKFKVEEVNRQEVDRCVCDNRLVVDCNRIPIFAGFVANDMRGFVVVLGIFYLGFFLL